MKLARLIATLALSLFLYGSNHVRAMLVAPRDVTPPIPAHVLDPVVVSVHETMQHPDVSMQVIESLEGVTDTLHWPRGESGPTIACGIDLGNIGKSAIRQIFTGLVGEDTLDLLLRASNVRGVNAKVFTHRYRNLRLSPEQVREANRRMVMLMWSALVVQFPGIESAPQTVKTSVLSVGMNRGIYNHKLDCLRAPIRRQDWRRVARAIGAMPAPKNMAGIAKRRAREAQLILQEEFQHDPD